MIRSLVHAEKQAVGLEHRLASAESQIRALTPARGRGTRQISDERQLLEAIGKVLKAHRVEVLMTIDYVKQTVLKAFSKVTLTIMTEGEGREIGRWLTPLSAVQQEILCHLGLERSVYSQLEIHNT